MKSPLAWSLAMIELYLLPFGYSCFADEEWCSLGAKYWLVRSTSGRSE